MLLVSKASMLSAGEGLRSMIYDSLYSQQSNLCNLILSLVVVRIFSFERHLGVPRLRSELRFFMFSALMLPLILLCFIPSGI